eukprot:1189029-Prorocentrum_minimum.AAC.4
MSNLLRELLVDDDHEDGSDAPREQAKRRDHVYKDAKLTVCVVVVPKYTLVYVQLLFEVQAKSQVFSGLDAKETALLEKYITVLSAPKNAYVLTAGSRPAFLGVVARGHLEAYTDNKRLVS